MLNKPRRNRLAWLTDFVGPGGADTAGLMARSAAFLYGSGAVLVLATVSFAATPGAFVPGIIGIAVLAGSTAAALFLLRDVIPTWIFPPLTALGTVLITLLMYFDGSHFSAYALIYVWAAIFAFYFYRIGMAVLQGVFIATAAAMELAARDPSALAAGRWLLIVGTVTAAGGVIQWLVGQLRRSDDQLRRFNADLELRVIQRTAELQASNHELEAFSYTVSHDLRAPLRAIDGFSRVVLEEHGAALGEEGRTHMDAVVRSSRTMGQLIEALLNFSRFNRAPIRRQTVDLGDCVVKALEPLGKELKERRIDVEIGSLPQRQADPVLLQEVFANLLGNAVKFTRESAAPRIEVGVLSAADEQGKEVYFVRDNGAGFDMRYASKLFGVFQRLHREEEFEGTGAGLAIVQRILLRHGGRIWAESVKGQGATFYFTIGEEEEFVAPAGEPPASVDLDHVST